ncbi:hypothetical protein C0991_010694 [Blastosporella zonata]|nr:hypothetical protein C0991_010694 [Blastosporella zonata]
MAQDEPLCIISITPEVIVALQELENIGGSALLPSTTTTAKTATVPASPTTKDTPTVIKSEHTSENEHAKNPPANNTATMTTFAKADTTTNQPTADVNATVVQSATPITALPTIVFPALAANSHLANTDFWYAVTVGHDIGVFQGW